MGVGNIIPTTENRYGGCDTQMFWQNKDTTEMEYLSSERGEDK